MKYSSYIKCVIVLFISVVMVSCYADIDPKAANSASAIIAVLGEYLLGCLSIMLVFILHLIFIGGIAVLTLGLISQFYGSILGIDPIILILIGFIIMAVALLLPKSMYTPRVNISKSSIKRNSATDCNKKSKKHLLDLAIQIVAGVVIGIILHFLL